MSVDISDPQIQSAYTAVVRNEPTNWLILTYAQTRDKLTVLTTGTGGIEELQKSLPDDDAYFAFVREEKAFCLINFFPSGIPGVRRARALVHARAVTSLFKASQATITVSSATQVEISAIRSKLGLDRLPLYEKAPRAANGLRPSAIAQAEATKAAQSQPTTFTPTSRLPRFASGAASPPNDDAPSPPSKGTTPLLLKRVSGAEKRDAPLPPPPAVDDADEYEIVNPPDTNVHNLLSRTRGLSLATSINDNRSMYSDEDPHNYGSRARPRGLSENSFSQNQSEFGYMSGDSTSPPRLFLTEAQEQAALSRAKWADEEKSESERSRRPRRGRTKSDIQREREREEQEMARAATEAAARKKYEKEQEKLREAEEEERAKAAFEEASRRRAADRLRREQVRREEEEREQRAAEARRLQAQKRRLEEARRAEERRRAEKEYQDEMNRREEERKKAQLAARDARMKEIQRRFESLRQTAGILLTGYVSVQPGNTIVWRRRFFQLQGDSMLFFKNSEETDKLMDSFRFRGVTGIKEWNQGYDDIRSIPHSWAVEFRDDAAWLFFADSEEDKDVLISLIMQLSKLK